MEKQLIFARKYKHTVGLLPSAALHFYCTTLYVRDVLTSQQKYE